MRSRQVTLFDADRMDLLGSIGLTVGGPKVIVPALATTPEVDSLLAAHAPVAIGVSGGKDSCAAALATIAHLDAIGHGGPQILVHSDLGRVEWKDSLPTCERLAARLGRELVVLRRRAGDMMDRWSVRWRNNVARYARLACVKLILPWSTASMRFCTSELKTAVICGHLVKRFPGQTILSVSGIRRDESTKRKRAPVAKRQKKLTRKKHATAGLDWNAIVTWQRADVLAYLENQRFPLHEAYTVFGSSRVSCAYCIMASRADLVASTTCRDNREIYREMVDLEVRSSFAFQDDQWLGDVAPGLLDADLRSGLAHAKEVARVRREAEARIPKHLLYTRNWPTCIPTFAEAELLAEVRTIVSSAVGIRAAYLEPDSIVARYRELMDLKQLKVAS
jgi:3'-phosphoadenosine 5'-phosphosulfate sulfotransferase (PAPS reductase)/FAD synthetase